MPFLAISAYQFSGARNVTHVIIFTARIKARRIFTANLSAKLRNVDSLIAENQPVVFKKISFNFWENSLLFAFLATSSSFHSRESQSRFFVDRWSFASRKSSIENLIEESSRSFWRKMTLKIENKYRVANSFVKFQCKDWNPKKTL